MSFAEGRTLQHLGDSQHERDQSQHSQDGSALKERQARQPRVCKVNITYGHLTILQDKRMIWCLLISLYGLDQTCVSQAEAEQASVSSSLAQKP